MAKRSAQDTAAAKAKKQKMILIVGGVLLLAVAAFQVPKLMKGGGSTAAPASTVAGAPAAGTPAARRTVPVAVASRADQGLRRDRGRFPAARRGRQGGNEPARLVHALRGQGSIRPAGRRRGACRRLVLQPERCDLRPTRAPARRARILRPAPPSARHRPATPAAPPAPVLYATIDFNTKPQQVQVKGTFPTPEPLFVLRSLTKKQAKINVAGGSFDGGKPVTLKLGKKVTLVNTATGVRYVLKLTYAGAQPEVIQGFTTTPAGDGAAATTTTP